MVRHTAQPSPSSTDKSGLDMKETHMKTSGMDVSKVLESARACFESELLHPIKTTRLMPPADKDSRRKANETITNPERTNVRRRRVISRNQSLSAPVSPDAKAQPVNNNNNNTIMMGGSELNKALVSPLKSTPMNRTVNDEFARGILKRPSDNEDSCKGMQLIKARKLAELMPSTATSSASTTSSTVTGTSTTVVPNILTPATATSSATPSPVSIEGDRVDAKENVEVGDKAWSRKRNSEVHRLRQDEGVQMMLDTLGSSTRRKTTTKARFLLNKRDNSNHGSKMATVNKRKISANDAKSSSDSNCSRLKGKGKIPASFLTLEKSRRKGKSVTTKALMDDQTLAKLNKLDKSVYLTLCANQQRFRLGKETQHSLQQQDQNESEIVKESAVSTANPTPLSLAQFHQKNRRVGSTSLSLISSLDFKDVLMRCSSEVGQIILNPLSTGLKASFNANVFEELSLALNFLQHEHCCKIVLLTGLGGFFCQGIDLTQLSYDSIERQRRSASQLSQCIRSLVLQLLDFKKPLVAGINGSAVGLGVTMLPYFDLVYASDKAELRCDYSHMGQLPEAFATSTLLAVNDMRIRDVFCRDRSLSAEEAKQMGLVSEVLWPDGFMQSLMPMLNRWAEQMEEGLSRSWLKRIMRRNVLSIMDEETKELAYCWTRPDFAAMIKERIKTDSKLVFQ